MSLISCHSSNVSSLRHSSYVTYLMFDLMWLISCLDLMSPITCHSSHVSSLRHSSHVLWLRHSSHFLSLRHWYWVAAYILSVATFNFCPWPLSTSHRKLLLVTSVQPFLSNIYPTRSVLLPRRIEIGFQSVSHSSQTRYHVTHLVCHHYVTQPGLKG